MPTKNSSLIPTPSYARGTASSRARSDPPAKKTERKKTRTPLRMSVSPRSPSIHEQPVRPLYTRSPPARCPSSRLSTRLFTSPSPQKVRSPRHMSGNRQDGQVEIDEWENQDTTEKKRLFEEGLQRRNEEWERELRDRGRNRPSMMVNTEQFLPELECEPTNSVFALHSSDEADEIAVATTNTNANVETFSETGVSDSCSSCRTFYTAPESLRSLSTSTSTCQSFYTAPVYFVDGDCGDGVSRDSDSDVVGDITSAHYSGDSEEAKEREAEKAFIASRIICEKWEADRERALEEQAEIDILRLRL